MDRSFIACAIRRLYALQCPGLLVACSRRSGQCSGGIILSSLPISHVLLTSCPSVALQTAHTGAERPPSIGTLWHLMCNEKYQHIPQCCRTGCTGQLSTIWTDA
jgi:hypothetical protein